MFQRLVELPEKQSLFIFGARGTGKSTLLKEQIIPAALKKSPGRKVIYIDLLDPDQEDRYLRRPAVLENEILAHDRLPSLVAIDEVQKVPRLLNVVHRLIENHKIRFVLTGSSARKLKRGSANLLAGRAVMERLFPLSTFELGKSFSLENALHLGSLPQIFFLESEQAVNSYLRSYVHSYIREEIQIEQLVRKLEPFRNFLEVSAQMNGKIINASKISREIGADTKTVQSYFSILEDTWLGFHLPGFHRSIRKSQKINPKFYFFDSGIKRALEQSLDSKITPGTSQYGDAFEHWVICEIFRLNEYLHNGYRLSYLETKDGGEVDLILSKGSKQIIMLEIKSTKKIDEVEVRKLGKFSLSIPGSQAFYLSRDPSAQKINHVNCLPWLEGLKTIFKL